jgi:DNA-binding MarR family transcriptional regulator
MESLLKLDKQLCFKIYAVSRMITKEYKPFLDKLDLTYPQYLVMMVLWEFEKISVKELGNKLYLDSGTLTPLLKKLEAKGMILRERDSQDERVVNIIISDKGKKLKKEAEEIPKSMANQGIISPEEFKLLSDIFNKIIDRKEGESK